MARHDDGAVFNPDVLNNPRSVCGCVSRAVSCETPYVNRRGGRRIDHRHVRMCIYIYTHTPHTHTHTHTYTHTQNAHSRGCVSIESDHCMHVRHVASRRARRRSFTSINRTFEARTPGTGMRYMQQSSDTCAITTWRDRVYKRSRLRKDRSISSFATPSRALSDMRCQSRRVAVVVVIRICTGGVTSLGIARFLLLFPRNDPSPSRFTDGVLFQRCDGGNKT